MKKITIINAYGDKNIGDAVILNVALKFIHSAFTENCKISILCENTKSFSKFTEKSKNTFPFQLPYGYAISSKNKKTTYLTKIIRFINIFIISYYHIFLNILINKPLPETGFYSYISEIKNAGIVIGMGGGYLITNNKHKDYFGLLLSLLPIYIANIYKKKLIFFPISFGPFASDMQSKLVFNAIKNSSILARDYITYNELKKLDKENKLTLNYAPDLALFYPTIKINSNNKNKYIILTAREWFSNKQMQKDYEKSLITFIDKIWKNFNLKTIFIPMARNIIEDDDNRLAGRIMNEVKNKKSFEIINPKNINELQNILGNARIAICTRMHSAIISTTVHTPFIAIGYGHKTLGFAKSFDIEKWHIDIKDVNYNKLLELYIELIKKSNYKNFIEIIKDKQKEIQKYRNLIINDLKNYN